MNLKTIRYFLMTALMQVKQQPQRQLLQIVLLILYMSVVVQAFSRTTTTTSTSTTRTLSRLETTTTTSFFNNIRNTLSHPVVSSFFGVKSRESSSYSNSNLIKSRRTLVSSSLSLFLENRQYVSPSRYSHIHRYTFLHKHQVRMSSSTTATSTIDNERMFKRAKINDDITIAVQSSLDDESKSTNKIIGTHSGSFQADEAMGCWLIKQLPEYKNATIIRTRDMNIVGEESNKCNIILDVGGIYNHSTLRYDHHQRDYDEKYNDTSCTKLSASGLIYKHYGKEILQLYYPNLPNQYIDIAYIKIYTTLLEALDAIDTGVEPVPIDSGIRLLYKDSTGLSARVSRLNPRWNEDIDELIGVPPNPDERFQQAMIVCGNDFLSTMISIVESYIPARVYVEQAIKERFTTDKSGQIIKFPSGGLPWQSHLYDIEKELQLTNFKQLIKFVLYTDQSNMWRVQTVSVENSKFTNRISLPNKWCGVRDDQLESISGINGATFVHSSGFIGGNKNYIGALQMAQIAIQEYYENNK